MEVDILLGWAIPVDDTALGARLEAYAETKAAITTFRLCVQKVKNPTSGMGQLSPEVTELIVARVRDAVFDARMQDWAKIHGCVRKVCRNSHHFNETELANLSAGDELLDYDGRDGPRCTLDDIAAAEVRHGDAVQKHLIKLKGRRNKVQQIDRFTKCKNLLARDFGVDPYFLVHWLHTDDDDNDARLHITAYLTLNAFQPPVVQSSNNYAFSQYFRSVSTVDPALLSPPSECQIRQIKSAMRVLSLNVIDDTAKRQRAEFLQKYEDFWYTLSTKSIRQEAEQLGAFGTSDLGGWPKCMILAAGTMGSNLSY